MAKKMQRIYQIRVTLNGSKPPIWRKLAVPSDIVLDELHEVIQIAMGWTNSHLHQFRLHDKGLKPSPQEMARRFQRDEWGDDFLGRMRGERVFVAEVTSWGDPSDLGGEDEEEFTLGLGAHHRGAEDRRAQAGRRVSALPRWQESLPSGGLRRDLGLLRAAGNNRRPRR